MAKGQPTNQEEADLALAKRLQAGSARVTRAASRLQEACSSQTKETQEEPPPDRPLLPYADDTSSDDYDAGEDQAQQRSGQERYVKLDRNRGLPDLRSVNKRGYARTDKPRSIPKYLVKLPDHQPIILPNLDVSLIKTCLESTHRLSVIDLLQWLKSNEVLPTLKLWHTELLASAAVHDLMLHDFARELHPWLSLRQRILAKTTLATVSEDDAHLTLMAQRARTIVDNNRIWFEDHFIKYELEEEDKISIAISVLITAWQNLQDYPYNGFFGILLASPLAMPKLTYTRDVLDMWYILDEDKIKREKGSSLADLSSQTAEMQKALTYQAQVSPAMPASGYIKKNSAIVRPTRESDAETLAAHTLGTSVGWINEQPQNDPSGTRRQRLHKTRKDHEKAMPTPIEAALMGAQAELREAKRQIQVLREALDRCTCRESSCEDITGNGKNT